MMYSCIVDVFLIILPLMALLAPKALSPVLIIFALCYGRTFLLKNGCVQAKAGLQRHRLLLCSTAALLFWALITALWSVDGAESLSGWLRIASILIAGVASLGLTHHLRPFSVASLRVLVGVFSISVLLLFLENYTAFMPILWFMSATGKDYFSFITIDINRTLCVFAVIVWPVMYGFLRFGFPVVSAALMGLLLLVFAVMESQSATLGFVCAMFVYAAHTLAPKFSLRALTVAVPQLFFALPFFVQWALHAPVMQEIILVIKPHVSSRFPIWESLLSHNHGMLVWGQGLRTSHLIPMAPEVLAQLNLKGPPMHPHNTALQLVLELGMIGLALTSAIVFFLLRTLRSIADEALQRAALATIIAYLVTGLFSFNLWMNWWMACAFLSACLLYRIQSLHNLKTND